MDQAVVRAGGRTHANGGDVALGVGVVRETEEQARLADARVTDQEELCAVGGEEEREREARERKHATSAARSALRQSARRMEEETWDELKSRSYSGADMMRVEGEGVKRAGSGTTSTERTDDERSE